MSFSHILVCVLTPQVNVLINGAASRNAGFDAGIFSTAATNVRVFRGPPETCNIHPWDAMILRDCTPNSTNLYDIEAIASRKWDILAMKMCEDFDRKSAYPVAHLLTLTHSKIHGLS